MFQKRLSGEPVDFSVLGIFVINRRTIQWVSIRGTTYTGEKTAVLQVYFVQSCNKVESCFRDVALGIST